MTQPARTTRSLSTISARINGERVVLASWTRAILLQMAHPLIAAGVVGHSGFRAGARASAHRLHATVQAMLGLTFGSDAERQRVLENIRAIHARVRGTLREDVGTFRAGTPYSAEDPDLVLWVHATLIDSTIRAYRDLVADLTPAEIDRYCDEAAQVAIDLGARPEEVPRTGAGLAQYMTAVQQSGALAIGDDARAIADTLLGGPLATLAAPAAWVNRQLTMDWLPDDIRRAYGISWSAAAARRAGRLRRLLRGARRYLPAAVARWRAARPG